MVWILADGTPSSAQSFYESKGITFGWFINDQDNTEGAYTLAGTSMAPGVPWVGVIDATTMEIVASRPTNTGTLVQSLATD